MESPHTMPTRRPPAVGRAKVWANEAVPEPARPRRKFSVDYLVVLGVLSVCGLLLWFKVWEGFNVFKVAHALLGSAP